VAAGSYRADGHGRAAHDPAMMVAWLLCPPAEERVSLELVETRTFGSRVVYVRYRAR
jgi:hypothetical protein